MAPGERDIEIDLENGVKQSTESTRKDSVSGLKTQLIEFLLAKISNMFVDGKMKGGLEVNICHDELNPNAEQAKPFDHTSAEKKVVKEKRKKVSNKRSQKPPRPPRGPPLDAADQKLVKEITQLAMLKRARVERLKALKKMKIAKGSSSNSNIFAMVFTILFCSLIIFQAISSRVAYKNVQVFPISEQIVKKIQHSSNFSARHPNTPGYGAPDVTKPKVSLDHMRRAVR